jgi:hypothetical protein
MFASCFIQIILEGTSKTCQFSENQTCVLSQWPPVLTLFERGLSKGFGEDSKLLDGSDMKIAKVILKA